MREVHIRQAGLEDAAQLAEIYAPYCDTPISFEEVAPSAAEMAERWRMNWPIYPWLVAERQGRLVGYAYACGHRQRAAYRWTAESSVYLRQDCQGQGLGRLLYQHLLEILQRQGFRTVLAGITLPNPASVGLHQAMGFEAVGTYREVGFKQDQWRSVQWLARSLEGPTPPAETLWLPEIGEDQWPSHELKTPQLSLRPLLPHQAPDFAALVSAERERLRSGFPNLVAEVTDGPSARRFLREKVLQWARRESFTFGLWDSRPGLVGYLSLKHFDWSVPKGDMGYWLAAEAQGRGWMREAVRALLPFSLQDLGLERLFLRIHPDNGASQRVAESCGFQREGILRADYRGPEEAPEDVLYYSWTRRDWLAQRGAEPIRP